MKLLEGTTKGMSTAAVVGLPFVASTLMLSGQPLQAILFGIYWVGAVIMFVAVFQGD